MRVCDEDGHCLGRLRDLVAEREGNELRVRDMLLGEMQLLKRIGLPHDGTMTVPWSAVVKIDDSIGVRAGTKPRVVH